MVGAILEEVGVGIAAAAPSALEQDGLSRDQQLHFAEHGWVHIEGVIDPDLCRACVEASERLPELLTSGRTKEPEDRGNVIAFRDPHLIDPVFYELYKSPGMLEAARQLIGHDKIRNVQSLTLITRPDPERHTRPEVVNNRRTWGWHRSHRPRNVIMPHEDDPKLIRSSLLTIGMYFVPISPEHGATAFLDGSHRYEGAWTKGHDIYDEASDRFDLVQPSGGVGSITLFSEALLHSSAPVLSDQHRYALFAFLAVPWFNRWGIEPHLQPYFADQRLRELFAPCETDDPDA